MKRSTFKKELSRICNVLDDEREALVDLLCKASEGFVWTTGDCQSITKSVAILGEVEALVERVFQNLSIGGK